MTCWILIGQSEASADASGASSGDAASRLGITRGGAGGHVGAGAEASASRNALLSVEDGHLNFLVVP